MLNLIVSLYMVGVIWTIQLVHYPSFLYVDTNSFKKFSDFHQLRMTILVAPAMILELSFSLWTYMQDMNAVNFVIFALSLILWALTFIIFVPMHRQLLEDGKELKLITKMIKFNWVRTFFWSIKALSFYFYQLSI